MNSLKHVVNTIFTLPPAGYWSPSSAVVTIFSLFQEVIKLVHFLVMIILNSLKQIFEITLTCSHNNFQITPAACEISPKCSYDHFQFTTAGDGNSLQCVVATSFNSPPKVVEFTPRCSFDNFSINLWNSLKCVVMTTFNLFQQISKIIVMLLFSYH